MWSKKTDPSCKSASAMHQSMQYACVSAPVGMRQSFYTCGGTRV